jgi:hypothetical protein
MKQIHSKISKDCCPLVDNAAPAAGPPAIIAASFFGTSVRHASLWLGFEHGINLELYACVLAPGAPGGRNRPILSCMPVPV